ncbi:propanediol/glycerol family dehydratase large subunit, partial [Weissella cibaria]|nr:propanediol/glycerol family dehydratase large subunit [Weissella cibaria]
GNDQAFSHSDIRRTERLLGQFIAGTDYVSSGYSSTPNYDNTFAGSNTDAMDYDDYYIMERDLMINGGIHPVSEEEVIKGRNKAAKALQAVFEELGLPKITDEEVEAATYANTSKDMPDRNMVEDMKSAQELLDRGITAVDIIKALYNRGYKDVAEAVLNLQKQKVCGDFLQTSSIFDKDLNIISAVNNANDYQGPGTGYRLDEDTEEWERIKNVPFAID